MLEYETNQRSSHYNSLSIRTYYYQQEELIEPWKETMLHNSHNWAKRNQYPFYLTLSAKHKVLCN